MKLALASTSLMALAVGISCNTKIEQENVPLSSETQVLEKRSWLKNINAREAFLMLGSKQPPVVLDIRTPFEHKGGRIKGSMLNNFYSQDFELKLSEMDRAQPVIVHCASGGRSSQSLKLFKALEFEKVFHLDGGIKAWNAEGYPLVKD